MNGAQAGAGRLWSGVPADERRARRRAVLLDTAYDILGTEGWAALTVRAVVERSRLHPRYFYESFPDLDALAVAVYDRVVAELGGLIAGALRTAGTDPSDQVRAVVATTVAFVDGDRRRGRILYVEGLGNEALNRRRLEAGQAVVGFIGRYAEQHAPAAVRSDPIGRVGAALLVGGFSRLLADWLAGRIAVPADALVDDATALFLALGDAAAARATSRAAAEDLAGRA